MAGKRSGSYESVIRGVSQQVPEDRRQGQHFEQVNFLSDTIEGLVRRRGSELQDEVLISSFNTGNNQPTIDDTSSFKSYDFASDGGTRYSLFYRSDAKVSGSIAPFCFCINRETFEFVPCVFGSDTLFNILSSGGASAITNVLDYVYIAGNDITTNYTQSHQWNNPTNRAKGVFWVLAGNSDRKYSVVLSILSTSTNVVTTVTGSYTTDSAQYPGTLDTSDIPYTDPEYQKKVNDRTNDYNNASNAWIISSAASKLPSNIAQKLMEDLNASIAASSVAGQVTLHRVDGTVGILASPGYEIGDISTDDDSDKKSIRGVANEVNSEEELTALHFPGKVVRIIPENGSNINAKYVKGLPNGNGTTITDITKWTETAGVITTPINCFAMGIVVGGTFYLAGSKAELMRISGLTDEDVPEFVGSAVGDDITVRPPHFAGRKISYLGSFQDRLIIGSENVLSFSRTGKYLDFFRETMTSVLDDDGVEFFGLGSEGDIIRASTYFDKNLIFFGTRRQYFLSGQQVLTPKTASLTQLTAHEDAVDSDPQSSGNFIFYMKYRNGIGTMHQFQQGLVQDSPESYECSAQLSDYMSGKPIEIRPLTTPNKVVIRLKNNRNKLYFYDYLDDQGQRLFDSWSRWEWDEQLGYHVGMAYRKGNLAVVTVRNNGVNWFAAVDKFVFDRLLTDKPILDSLRKYNDLPDSNSTKFFSKNSEYDNTFLAYDNTSPRFLLGQKYENKEQLLEAYPSENSKLWVGFGCEAYVTPTNPYIKDNKDKAIINGRLTINKLTFSVDKTAGMIVDYVTKYITTPVISIKNNGYILATNSVVGTQPIIDNGKITAWINKDGKEFKYTVRSNKWLPVTIKAIEWTGQFFFNAGRA